MKKKLFSILIMTFIMNVMVVYSQSPEAFEVVVFPSRDSTYTYNRDSDGIRTKTFHQSNWGYTYFPAGYSVFIRNDNTGEITTHNKFVDPEPWGKSMFTMKIEPQPYSNKLWIRSAYAARGVCEFITIENGIFGREICDVTGCSEGDYIPRVSSHRCGVFPHKEWEEYYTENDAYFYFMVYEDSVAADGYTRLKTSEHAIVKFSPLAPDKPIYKVYDTVSPVSWLDGSTEDSQYGRFPSVVMPDSTVWMLADKKIIVRFDEKTKEFTKWNIDSILGSGRSMSLSKDCLFVMYDEENHKNSKVCIFAGVDNGIIIWDEGEWRIKEINFDGSNIYASRDEALFQVVFSPLYWSRDEIAFAFFHRKDSVLQSLYNRSLIIYNYRTNKARDFIIPEEVFKGLDVLTATKKKTDSSSIIQGKLPMSHIVRCIKDLEDGRKGILYNLEIFSRYGGMYVIYDPNKDTSSAVTEKVDRVFPDLSFKGIYPNPVVQTLKAEIWCLLKDVNNLELGLYDFMGKKLLDLRDHFEYNTSTSMITVTFDVPENLSNGTYFLTVRNGNEIKTKGVLVSGD